MRRKLRTDLDLEILDRSVLIHPLRQDSGIVADIIRLFNIRPDLRCTLCKVIHVLLRHSIVREILCHLCIRSDNYISIRRIGNMDSHICITWNRIDRHRKKLSGPAVQNDVISLGADHAISFDTKHIRNLSAAKSGTVDHPTGLKGSVRCRYRIKIFSCLACSTADSCHFMIEEIFRSVLSCILRQCDRIVKGIYDSGIF